MSDRDRAASELVHRLHTAPWAQSTVRRRTLRSLRVVAAFALALAVPSAAVGFSMNDPLALAVSGVMMGCAFMASDISRVRLGALSPMTLYAFTWTLTSIANTLAVLNQDTASRSTFFIYAIDEHLPLALKISWLGLVLPVLGFQWASRSAVWQSFGALMPRVRGYIPRDRLLQICVIAAVIGFGASVTRALPSLGTITGIVFLLPHLAAFTLARAGMMYKWPAAVWTGLAIATVEAIRALLSAYLRSDIFSPIFAYAVGVLMGAGSLRALRGVYMAPVYAMAVPFVIYFAAFAEVREGSNPGVDRLWAIAETRELQQETQVPTRHNFLSRLSSINQLTQIGRVVREDGFLNGATLEYLAYAWIPRFLWPEKPTIAKGAWFAMRIDQARIHNGRITNSVNMTIPGELYLNFGWLGLVLGAAAFGGLIALFWATTGFWRDPHNVLGAAFGFYLLWIGLGAGADLQLLVTLVAMYALFAAAGILFPRLRRRWSPSERGPDAPAASMV